MAMNERSLLSRFAALDTLLALTACGSGNNSGSGSGSGSGGGGTQGKTVNFSETIFIGDSLTAGYQSGSLLDTQQVHGWAPLLAQQANFPITVLEPVVPRLSTTEFIFSVVG